MSNILNSLGEFLLAALFVVVAYAILRTVVAIASAMAQEFKAKK